jgi:hypothetical protein
MSCNLGGTRGLMVTALSSAPRRREFGHARLGRTRRIDDASRARATKPYADSRVRQCPCIQGVVGPWSQSGWESWLVAPPRLRPRDHPSRDSHDPYTRVGIWTIQTCGEPNCCGVCRVCSSRVSRHRRRNGGNSSMAQSIGLFVHPVPHTFADAQRDQHESDTSYECPKAVHQIPPSNGRPRHRMVRW